MHLSHVRSSRQIKLSARETLSFVLNFETTNVLDDDSGSTDSIRGQLYSMKG